MNIILYLVKWVKYGNIEKTLFLVIGNYFLKILKLIKACKLEM